MGSAANQLNEEEKKMIELSKSFVEAGFKGFGFELFKDGSCEVWSNTLSGEGKKLTTYKMEADGKYLTINSPEGKEEDKMQFEVAENTGDKLVLRQTENADGVQISMELIFKKEKTE